MQTGEDLLPGNAYTGYQFAALAICNTLQTPKLCKSTSSLDKSRLLYVASLIWSNIYVLEICHQEAGLLVDAAATVKYSSLVLVAGRSWAGFADGVFSSALFNQPVDIELNTACSLLYISDFGNNRIRLMNLTAGTVSTAVGSGQSCWKAGLASCNPQDAEEGGCNPLVFDCASLQYPMGIGLSEDESLLYIAANTMDALYQLQTQAENGKASLSVVCSFSFDAMTYGDVQECSLNLANSKGCMLYNPFDAVAFELQVYVGATQAVTRIDTSTGGCEQIAGNFFDLQTSGLRDGIMPLSSSTSTSSAQTTLVNIPFKMAIARGTGVLYFADLMNGAVRRILVQNACICPVGYQLVSEEAASCYNPSPTWAQASIPSCTAQEAGQFYALPGDTSCSRSCADALQEGLTFAPCLFISPQASVTGSMTYAQLLSNLNPPQNTLSADWYGETSLSNDGVTKLLSWNAIFSSSVSPNTPFVSYRQGSVPGRAPFSNGDFLTLTMAATSCWEIETNYNLKPQLILPGLWYPCGEPITITSVSSCACQTNIFEFEATPTTSIEESAAVAAPKRWQALRNAAVAGQALNPGDRCQTPSDVLSKSGEGCASLLTQTSIFMIMGTDEHAPATCPQQEEGPCFPSGLNEVQTATGSFQSLPISPSPVLWQQDGIQNVQCRLGWPAHFYCPDGYTWIVPTNFGSCAGPTLPALATCISCLPGTYSYTNLTTKKLLGGPYQCLPCMPGFYASNVGSSVCLECPANSYASAPGSSACTQCAIGSYTLLPAAYSASQCVNCPPGTGSCSNCTVGEYQLLSGQIRCEIVPAGYYGTPLPGSVMPTPCPLGQYQNLQGRTSCNACPQFTTTPTIGATACVACSLNTNNNCLLSIGNVCGMGCGLNKYFSWSSGQCVACAKYTLNALDPCSTDPNVCTESILEQDGYYLSSTGQVSTCPSGTQANPTLNGCVTCTKGYYSNANVSGVGCRPCEAGSYSNADGASTCTLCSAGQSSFLGASVCFACDHGEFAPVPGSSQCLPCPAGLIAPSLGSTQCSPCALLDWVAPAPGMAECNVSCNVTEGFYALAGDSACRYCSGGIINSTSSACQGCGLGHYLSVSMMMGRTCVPCPAGLVNLDNSNAPNSNYCRKCDSLTAYAASNGMFCIEALPGYVPNGTTQSPCPLGTSRNNTQTTCVACAPGTATIANTHGATACTQCSAGYYASAMGATTCSLCPAGSVSTLMMTGCSKCPMGKYAAGGGVVCNACSPNTYCSTLGCTRCIGCTGALPISPAGASICLACPSWTLFDAASGTCTGCPAGSFMVMSAAVGGGCYKCPVGTYLPFANANSSSDCKPCPNGSVASTIGAVSCSHCTAGSSPSGATACQPCAAGSYNTDGGKCIPCAAGEYSSSQGATQCAKCMPGTFQPLSSGGGSSCMKCPPGTFSDGSTGLACISCNGLPGTFAAGFGQVSCLPKTTQCPEYYYINQSFSPSADNECVRCAPCPPDDLGIAYDTSSLQLLSLTSNKTVQYLNELCPGTTYAPLYNCISNAPVAGMWLSLSQSVGAALGQSVYTVATVQPYSFQTCTDNQYDSSIVAWVAGPSIQACYVGCLYGISSKIGLTAYAQAFVNQPPPYPEDPQNNMFLQRMLPYKKTICAPSCPNGNCPLGRYRPLHNAPGCGPPCALPAFQSLCANVSSTACITGPPYCSGCIGICSNAPANADYVGGGPILGQNWCPWRCLQGWHLSDDQTECLPCNLDTQSEVEALCNSTYYALIPATQCQPWFTSLDLCKYCAPIAFGRLIGWNQTCQYQCYSGYYLNTSWNNNSSSGTCLPCNTIWLKNWTLCPVGFYLDESICYNEGLAPACRPCDPGKESTVFISNGGLSSTQCKVSCMPGFHTVVASSGIYVDYSNPSNFPTVLDVHCKVCLPSDLRSCDFSTSCFPGYFRNLSVKDGQIGGCVQCKESHQCPTGFYASPCLGSNVTDAECIPCDPSLLVNQQFVSYAEQQQAPNRDRITTGDCPRVCINNYVQAQTETSICVSCQSLVMAVQEAVDPSLISSSGECLQPGVQPSICGFVYAYWNAAPRVQWWDAAHTPPYLTYSTQPINAAGICWACPLGTATLPDSQELCVPLPGYISVTANTLLPTAKVPIPSLPSEVYFVMQIPRLPLLMMSPLLSRRRHLLLSVSAKKPTLSSSPAKRHLLQASSKDEALSVLISTAASSSSSSTSLLLAVVNNKVQACPYGSYKSQNGDGVCYVCPQGSSTIGEASDSMTACLCQYGYYLTSAAVVGKQNAYYCAPCPVDTFLNTTVSITTSAASQQQQRTKCIPCPKNMSTLGTQGATSCACALGFVPSASTPDSSCHLCPAGYFCPPCTTADSMSCPIDQQPQECFPGSTSPVGSYSIENCTCLNGLVRATRPQAPLQFYCQPLPQGTMINPTTGLITCLPGWTWIDEAHSSYADGCQLCPPGSYAAVDTNQQVILSPASGSGTFMTISQHPFCFPCPLNTYNPTTTAIGNCTACPTQQITLHLGSNSLQNCSCPPPLTISVKGGCVGCMSYQYHDSASGACVNCPVNSLAQPGASSLDDCLCSPGYQLQGPGENSCQLCPLGFYSNHASNSPCTACPKGSTTASTGSTSISACGASQALCLPGYQWRMGVGCFP